MTFFTNRFHFLPLPATSDRSGGSAPLFDLSSDLFVEPLETDPHASEKNNDGDTPAKPLVKPVTEPTPEEIAGLPDLGNVDGNANEVRYDSPYDALNETRDESKPLVRPTVEPRYDAPYEMNKPVGSVDSDDSTDGAENNENIPDEDAPEVCTAATGTVRVVRVDDGQDGLSEEKRAELARAAEAMRAAQKARNEAIRAKADRTSASEAADENAATHRPSRNDPDPGRKQGGVDPQNRSGSRRPLSSGAERRDAPAESVRKGSINQAGSLTEDGGTPAPVDALLALSETDRTSSAVRHRRSKTDGEVEEDTRTSRLKIMIFAGAMALLFLLGILIPLRPTHSESEKRDLTPFPSFSFGDFLSGAYFSGIETWYADSFPGREGLIAVHTALRSLYGFRGEQFTPGGETSDTIGSDLPSDMDSYLDSLEESRRAAESGSDSDDTPTIDPVEGEKINGLYVSGNTAYELSYYNETSAMTYAALISRASNRLGSDVQVFDLIVPLSYSIHLPQSQQKTLGVANAADAIGHVFAAIEQNSDVTTIEVLPTLLSHRDEYLYFRTDHHWTARGAYYAYTAFCETAGITPKSLSDWEAYSFDGFLGTLYSDAGKPAALKNDPDTLEAWVPNGTDDVYITDRDGERLRYRGGLVRRDTDTFYQSAASKYNCFLMGDHPLCEIHNPDITDGSSIAVVKESFGNAFVPFLVDSYEYVYVIDYRYFGGSLTDFVAGHDIGQVLFINNAVAVWSKDSPRLSELSSLIGN